MSTAAPPSAVGTTDNRLSEARLLLYSLPALISSVAALPLVLFLPAFYSDTLGVPLATVGLAIAASRLFDVVTDPLIGTLSDRLPTRFGRRKPWILLGTPIFVLAVWQLFVPGESADANHLFVWSAVLYLGTTLLDLPHKAWGAELSTDYDERSRITSRREALATAGQVALLGALLYAGTRGIQSAAAQLQAIAWVVAIGLPVFVLAALARVPEGKPEHFDHAPRSAFAGLRLVAQNPAFLRMVGCVIFFVSGIAIQGTLHRLVLADVLQDEAAFTRMIFFENIATLAAVPLWLAVSHRIGKHNALFAAALWLALLSLPLIPLREGDTTALITLVAVRGSSFASILFLSNSMAADVIDVDTLASGEQRSGLYFAVWGMANKLALALGVILGTTIPALFGYDPTAGATSPAVQSNLMLIYGALPAALMALGALFLRNFPITKSSQAATREALTNRLAS